ncbi:alpha/beta hydrolase [Methylotetracoccus oryzae]|uniref:alpha/beta hydrolase n=1 Tax=Methylotetracoccus oryzae TaxID=1919059 RepID=UPI0019133C1C|nr:alpha/beta hydrolase [Methylotetracoccus oryzae]
MLTTLLTGLALIYGALLLAACGWQNRLVYFPQAGSSDDPTPSALKIDYDDVWVPTADGERLHGWFLPVSQPRATAVLFHGNAGNLSHRLPWLPMFQQLRWSALLFDYRGYGTSTGKPSEDGTYADAAAVWRYLTETRHVAADQIVLIGESLGGAIAAHQATRAQPAALVLHSAFTSVPDLAAELYPFLPARLLARFDYDTRRAVTNARCPVLVIHSRDDDIVPFSHGRRLFAAASEPKQFIELRGSHNGGFVFMRREWVTSLDAFLSRFIGPGYGEP